MSTTTKRKQYTAEFKAQAIELLEAGRPVAELAQDLCISTNLLSVHMAIHDEPTDLDHSILGGFASAGLCGGEFVEDIFTFVASGNDDADLEIWVWSVNFQLIDSNRWSQKSTVFFKFKTRC